MKLIGQINEWMLQVKSVRNATDSLRVTYITPTPYDGGVNINKGAPSAIRPDLKLRSAEVSTMSNETGNALYKVNCSYERESKTSVSNKSWAAETTAPTMERRDYDLMLHKDWLPIWTHYCCRRTGTTHDGPTVEDTTLVTHDPDFVWVRDLSMMPDGFEVEFERTKKEESYTEYYPVIRKRYFYDDVAARDAALDCDDKIETPPNTYGKVGGVWLKHMSDIIDEDDRFGLEFSYVWHLSLDSDIYGS